MIYCSHVLAIGDTGAYDLLIIFFKGAIYDVFDTLSPLILFTNIHFLYKNSDKLKPRNCYRS